MYPKTYRYCVSYKNETQSYASATIGGDDDLDKAKAGLFKDMKYYLSLPRDIVEIELTEFCATCKGDGEIFVPYKRQSSSFNIRGKNKRCPDCKGKGTPKDIIRL